MKTLLALAYALVTALQPASAQTLRFDWPAGTVGRVETTYSREHSSGQVVDATVQLRMTYRMRVLPHPEGRLIEYDDQTYVDSSGDLEPGLTALLPLWVPARIVNGQGQFIRIERAERIRQNIIDMFEPKLRSDAARNWPAFRDYVERMISDEGLRGLAAADWDALGGRWIGFPIKENVTESDGSIQVLDVRVPTRVSTGMLRRAPCTRLGVLRECGTYQTSTQIDRDGSRLLYDALMRGMDPVAGIEWLDNAKAAQVVLESDTMLPHEYTITRTVRQAVQQNGATTTVTDIERIHSVFTYVDEQ